MKWDAILSTIRTLAGSQGFYGRLLRDISNLDEDQLEAVKGTLEGMNFGSPVDLVLYLET